MANGASWLVPGHDAAFRKKNQASLTTDICAVDLTAEDGLEADRI